MNRKYWYVLISCCALMAANMGICLNAYTVFYEPVCASLNVLRGDLATHATISNLMCGVVALFVPRFLNSKSFKPVLIVGTLATGGSLILMSFADSLMAFYILGALRGFGLGCFGVVVCSILINNWFNKKHGTMISIMMSFSGIAGAILSPVFSSIITNQNYHVAYIVAGVLIIVFDLPAILLPYSFLPENDGMKPYGYEEKEVILAEDTKKVSYLQPIIALLVLYAVGSTLISNFTQFLPSYAYSLGLDSASGALMVSSAMIGNILAKLCIGTISDRFGAKKAVTLFFSINIVSLVILMFSKTPALQIGGAFLFGSIYAASSVGNVLVVKHVYPGREYNKAYSFVNFISNTIGAFGLMFMGYLYDFTNTYFYHYVLWIIVGIVNILLINFIVKRSKKC
ncbi:MAG: MFS transporter [Clostridia bacterium]|nr:MFS transporter [Clostridia bacterium]